MSLELILESYKLWFKNKYEREPEEGNIRNFINNWYVDVAKYVKQGMSFDEAIEEMDKFYNR